MAITQRTLSAAPAEVFEVFLNPYLYQFWVVGSKSIRGADEHWPAVGASFYHRFGVGAAHVRDRTEILELDVPKRLALRTFARPLGVARVVLTAAPAHTGGAVVTLSEEPDQGTRSRHIARLVDPFLHARNVEALRRLDRLLTIIKHAGGKTGSTAETFG